MTVVSAGKPTSAIAVIYVAMLCKDAMSRITCFSIGLLTVALVGCVSGGKPKPGMHSNASVPPASVGSPSTVPAVETVAYRVDLDGINTDVPGLAIDEIPMSATDSVQTDAGKSLQIDPVIIAEPNATVSVDVAVASPRAYTLAEIEQLALGNNPAIAAASATSGKAVGLWNQVGTRPNPTLGYFGQQLANRNTDQQGVFVEQEFVRGDKLKLNQAVLSHTTNAQRWETETQRLRVLTDVRVRFFEAVAAQQQLDATREFAKLASRGVDVALQRQRAEEGTLIEVLQSRTLLSEVTLAAEQSEAEFKGAWTDLAAIAGLSIADPVRLVAELDSPSFSPDWDVAYREIVAQSPELSVAKAIVCEKAALLKRQQVQMVPNVTGQFGAGYDNGTDSGMINVQVSAPIPVWNRNQGNISAAYADYTRATQDVTRIEQAIKSRLARAAQEFESSLAAVNKYQDEIIPQADKSLELSEEAYRAGELDFLQVLIVRRSFYESTIRFIAAKGKLAQASATIDGLLLTGGLDAPSDYTDGDGIRGASFGGQ